MKDISEKTSKEFDKMLIDSTEYKNKCMEMEEELRTKNPELYHTIQTISSTSLLHMADPLPIILKNTALFVYSLIENEVPKELEKIITNPIKYKTHCMFTEEGLETTNPKLYHLIKGMSFDPSISEGEPLQTKIKNTALSIYFLIKDSYSKNNQSLN